MEEGKCIPSWLIPPNSYSLSVSVDMLPLRAVPPIFTSPTWTQAEAHMRRSVWETLRPPPPPPPSEPESSTLRQIAVAECATEPYNPHLLGQAVEGGNDGGMEGWIGRKRGRMMEWLLNIQHAVESMWRVVGSLHYGAASRLHRFIFPILASFWNNSIAFLCLLSFVWYWWYFETPYFSFSSFWGCFSSAFPSPCFLWWQERNVNGEEADGDGGAGGGEIRTPCLLLDSSLT